MKQHVHRDTQARRPAGRPGADHETEAHKVAERFSGLTAPAHDGQDLAARRLAPPRPRTAGRPLPADLRGRLARALGTDLSSVRVHREPNVTERADAAALAHGKDVFLGSGVDTATAPGQYVLAHEVAHTVQQSGGGECLSSAEPTVQRLPRALERLVNRAQGKTNHVQPGDYTSISQLDSDGKNLAYKVKVDHSVGGTKHGIWKPNGMDTPAASAVASSRLARGLGMDKVIARNKFSQNSDGNGGSVLGTHSALVGGKQVRRGNQKDGYTYQDVDWTKPKLQKGMADLQLFDAITGQEDRHLGNVFVDEKKGRVRGIDDDMSFPTNADPTMADKSNLGLPQQVDKKTAKKVLKINAVDLPAMLQRQGDPTYFDPKGFNMSGPNEAMTPKQVTAAQDRLRAVQAHVQGLKDNGQLIKKWNKNTYEEAISKRAGNDFKGDELDASSYLHRAVQSHWEAQLGLKHETGAGQEVVGVNRTRKREMRAEAARTAMKQAGL